jgi:hypothetical protein
MMENKRISQIEQIDTQILCCKIELNSYYGTKSKSKSIEIYNMINKLKREKQKF